MTEVGEECYPDSMSRDNERESPPPDEEATASRVVPRPRAPSRDSDFTAGQEIAGRFRIVGRLGGGGMGEVYRADDHELGTSVALKFLPVELMGDPVRLERLRGEVRLARQISHPNVCRVFDIGDADGRPFLTMEYIDGEDLASLLRRIGRLPRDKAIELAREICAGVGAAHELGVIHRDLKPANVMIDGRGRARVADFGLARLAEDPGGGPDAQAGTPAYMAPEQLRGGGASRLSDIYALGLVLYELFTGQRARAATSLAQLREEATSSAPPTSPSDLVEDMDPAVERVIMRCLAADPEDRPPSALAVMAALPGGDPLAAMLKAGEMPSPELVAASGRRGSLSVRRALQLGALVTVGVAVSFRFFSTPTLAEQIGGILAPEVLAHQSRVLLEDLGHELGAVDSAWGFDVDWDVFSILAAPSNEGMAAPLLSAERSFLWFWYRLSPSPMVPWQGSLPGLRIGGVVTPEDPPLTVPGMALVRLGPQGDLLELRVVPHPPMGVSAGMTEGPIRTVTAAAGLDPSTVELIEWPGIGPMPGTSTVAWRVADDRSKVGFREIVASFAGDHVTWARVDPPPSISATTMPTQEEDRLALMFFVFFVVGSVVAGLNIRSGRWDRRGALRLAVAAFVFCFVGDSIGSHHPLNVGGEVRGFFTTVAYAGTRALMTWVLYTAIEPFIRRYRPASLISWSRLLAGRIADPAIGRDVLIGLAVYAVQSMALVLAVWTLGLGGWRHSGSAFAAGENPLSVASYLASLVRQPIVMLGSGLAFLLTYVLARLLLGRFKAVAPLFLWATAFMLVCGAYGVAGRDLIVLAPVAAISATGSTYLAVRHGLLSLVVLLYVSSVTMLTVATLDPSDWFFPQAALLIALIAGLTVFGIKTSTAQHLMPSRP